MFRYYFANVKRKSLFQQRKRFERDKMKTAFTAKISSPSGDEERGNLYSKKVSFLNGIKCKDRLSGDEFVII
jgi:hypothetical protein